MKTCIGFVSNSSSSSFVLTVDKEITTPFVTIVQTLQLDNLQDSDWESCDYERIRNIDELVDYAFEGYMLAADDCFYSDYNAEKFNEYLELLEEGKDILLITTGNCGYNYDMLKDDETYKQNKHIEFVSGGY